MARIRTIKPEFFTDAKILALTPLARLFYVALWCEADREGRLAWEPKTLQYRYLPAEKVRMDLLADELTNAGLVRLYRIDGKDYADVPGFLKHQVINNREQGSTIPPHATHAALTRERGVQGEGKEGKEGTTPIVPRGDEYSQDFRDLVKAYPKRIGTNPLPRAWKAFNAAIARGATIAQMLNAAKVYAASEVAGTQFTQQLATWLNGDCWKDAPTTSVVSPINFDPERSSWIARLTGFDRNKFWNPDQWGPQPGHAGCRVPADLMKARLDTPEFLQRHPIAAAG